MVNSIMESILNPYVILFFSFIFLILCRIIFHKNYLDCFSIILKHIECFKNKKGRISAISIFLYFIIPFFMAFAILQIRNIDDKVINLLTIIISVLTSMFFTLLTLILDMRSKVKKNKEYNASDASLSLKLLKETYYSIMFEILLSVIVLVLCFVELFSKQFNWICGLLIYYLSFVILTNLFMVLKRIFKVINQDIENT